MASCRRTADVAKPDPAPTVDAAKHAPPEAPPSRALLHGNVVELATGAVLFPHAEPKPPRAESAEIVLEQDETLRAIDLQTGATRWKTPAKCRSFALSKTSIACAESAAVVFVDRASGVATRVTKTSTYYSEPIVASNEHFVALLDPNVVVYDARGHVRSTATPTPGPMRGFGERVIAPSPEGYCFVTEPPDYYVRCFDLDSKPVRATKLALTKPTDPPGTRMMPIVVGPRHIVVGTFSFGGFPGARRSAVVRIADGAIVATVEDEVVALAERPDGTLDGLVVVAPEIRLLSLAGTVLWKQPVPYAEPFAAAASNGETLYLARYNPIATGVFVTAHRMTDGAGIWKGETKLPPIGHSKYRNDVSLELRPLENALVLRGDESSVHHVHLYDAKSGALRFYDAPLR